MSRLYTPEYSNELLDFVQDVFDEDVKHYYAKLRLEKLIELLEQGESLFESYREYLSQGKYEDCLTAFTIGSFYVYLIIPGSVQFNARNKSYAIYSDLKKLYQDELNMSNVLTMVLHKVDAVLNQNLEILTSHQLDHARKRAFSVEDPIIRHQLEEFHLQDNDSDSTNNHKSFASTEWKAPRLDPNDRLQLAVSSSKTSEASSLKSLPLEEKIDKTDEISAILSSTSVETTGAANIGLGTYNQNDNATRNIPRHYSLPVTYVNGHLTKDDDDSTIDQPVGHNLDGSIIRTNFSNHSVYLSGELEEDSNEKISYLSRLRQDHTIDSETLFDILDDPERREHLLLIDLRLPKRFESNHIVAPHILNIDPHVLYNSETSTSLKSFEELRKLVSNPLLNSIDKFKQIVYYTDTKSFMHLTFNYELLLFQLLLSKTVTHFPACLQGGYEQWKSFLHKKVAADPSFDRYQYLYKKGSSCHTEHNKEESQPSSIPVSTVPSRSPSKALDLQSSEVPPPIPKTAPPPLPDKLSIFSKDANVVYNRPAAPLPSDTHPPFLKSSAAKELRLNQRKDVNKHYHHTHTPFSIPTIEKNPNEFVSLSITGLRNMGNTCYINSMLQCLFACSQFRDLFLSSKYHRYLNPRYNNISISKWFNILFRKMYLNGGCSVVPNGFLRACHMLRPDFNIPSDQQDTQEFLLFLLDTLHDELSEPTKVANDYPNLLLHDDKSLLVDGKEYDKWFDESLKNNGLSPIDDIFQGQIENSLSCQRCGYTSYNYSTFYVLSLAIPTLPPSKAFSRTKRVIRLEDCINLYTRDEILKDENAWDCPKCGSQASSSQLNSNDDNVDKQKKRNFLVVNGEHKSRSKFFKLSSSRSKTRSLSPFKSGSSKGEKIISKSKKMTTVKSLNFITMPNILVIHLSRFFYDLTKKNETMINYPLILDVVLKNNKVARYRLYGIVNHFGNLVSGHYTSLVNKHLSHEIRGGKQKWYYFDDEVVKKEDNHGDFDKGITSISSGDVYVLFYERIPDM